MTEKVTAKNHQTIWNSGSTSSHSLLGLTKWCSLPVPVDQKTMRWTWESRETERREIKSSNRERSVDSQAIPAVPHPVDAPCSLLAVAQGGAASEHEG